jgi:hypothetical protein
MWLGCAGVPLKKGRQNLMKIQLFQTSPNMCDKPAVKKKTWSPHPAIGGLMKHAWKRPFVMMIDEFPMAFR